MPNRFEYSDNKSKKFWEIDVNGKIVTVRYGKIGTEGQSASKKFKSSDAASAAAEKQILEKLKKGYRASSKVTLIQFSKGSKVVEKSIYRRSKKDFFCIEKTYTEGTLVSKSPPAKDNKTGVLTITDYRFPVIPDSKSVLVFSDSLTPKEKATIRKSFKEYNGVWVNVDGFDSEPDLIEISGSYEAKEAEEISVKLFASRVEYCSREISKSEFNEYISTGMPFSKLNELESNTVASGAVFDERISLTVNDIDIPDSEKLLKVLLSQAKKKNPAPKTSPRPKECAYAVVSEKLMKRAWWGLTIYEVFDTKKIIMELEYDFVKGTDEAIETFNLFYDGQALEFLEDSGSNYDDIYVVDQKGLRHPFDVLDEDSEDDGDEY